MPTKQELETRINDRLKLDMEWSKMPKEDLEKFSEGLNDEDFVKRFVAQLANEKAGDKVEDQIMGWKPGMFLQMAGQMQNGGANPADFLMGGSPIMDEDEF